MPTDQGLEIEIREAGGKDIPLLYSSFLDCIEGQFPWRGLLSKRHLNFAHFAAVHRALLGELLSSRSTIVACQPEYPDQVFGYAICCPEGRLLDWLYVKYDFRRAGVASRLMVSAFSEFDVPVRYTIKTAASKFHKDRWNLEFNPKLLPGASLKGDTNG